MKANILKLSIASLLAAAMIIGSSAARADQTATNTPAASADKDKGGSKFYGPVTAVDTNAMTFVVGDQTYTVTSDSKITKADKTATLADAVVGEPARGSYVKASDGKLDITKVRFGKKGGASAKGKKKKDSSDTNAPTAPPAAN